MKILVVGGTSFVGRHIVEEAISKGHSVTLFNRGKSNPGLFQRLPLITGDRREDAGKLIGESWDAVIDTSAYSPADLIPVLDHISTAHYTFISTISVYDDFSKGAVTEQSTLHEGIEEGEVNGKTYGPLKVKCEEILRERLGEKALIIRPGIVAGAYDPTDRFTYWVLKLKEPGNVLIPGDESRKVQWVDVRDLAEFTIANAENSTNGTFNLTANPVTMKELVKTMGAPEMKPVWIKDSLLMASQVSSFELPFWMPVNEDFPEGFILADNAQAKATGWNPRNLTETEKSVLLWKDDSRSNSLKTGISKEKEQKLLAVSQKKQ